MEIFYKDQFGRLAFRSNAFIEKIDYHRMNETWGDVKVACFILSIVLPLASWFIK